MKADKIGRIAIRGVSNLVNFTVLTVIILLLAFAGYALWDSNQIYEAADKSQYAVYKPTIENKGKSFKELQAINPEVFAWLSVYGTNIDYPLTQGKDNSKYVNTNAEGKYSLAGALFLDYKNSRDFSDFNNILYGHHMEKKMMFGDIGNFAEKNMFDTHWYGNLYFDEKDHGIEFFAFIHTDAYDKKIFASGVKEKEIRQELLDYLLENAMYKRDVEITTEDRIVLLSTCSSSSTNGRDILIGKISDEPYDDPFMKNKKEADIKEQLHVDSKSSFYNKMPVWLLILLILFILIILIILILVIDRIRYKKKQSKLNRSKGSKDGIYENDV